MGACAVWLQEVADMIAKRDGYPANPEHIFLTGGCLPSLAACLSWGTVLGACLSSVAAEGAWLKHCVAAGARLPHLPAALTSSFSAPSTLPADGASVAVRLLLSALIRDSNDAMLVPIPQYPLYSASIQLYGGTLLPYNLKEQTGWSMDFNEITRDVHAAR